LNRPLTLAAVVVLCAAGLRARASQEPGAPVPPPPSCAHRVLKSDGVSALLSCDDSLADGERVVSGRDTGQMAGPALRLLGLPVDLNLASVEDLQSLPGVGPKLAERISAARPYGCPSELKQVEGIGPKRWADLRNAVTVDFSRRRLCADHL
jgi:hypothetical protein